jgi:hypothetical protein
MGRVPGFKGAYLQCAHNCWGILWAPVSGKAMAELICDGVATCAELAPFSPARFMKGTYFPITIFRRVIAHTRLTLFFYKQGKPKKAARWGRGTSGNSGDFLRGVVLHYTEPLPVHEGSWEYFMVGRTYPFKKGGEYIFYNKLGDRAWLVPFTRAASI